MKHNYFENLQADERWASKNDKYRLQTVLPRFKEQCVVNVAKIKCESNPFEFSLAFNSESAFKNCYFKTQKYCKYIRVKTQ